MLIWKVIEANPGITRAGIWERVEHGIPEGYALRRFHSKVGPQASGPTLVASARHIKVNCRQQARRRHMILLVLASGY
jgi:hypothetical protein